MAMGCLLFLSGISRGLCEDQTLKIVDQKTYDKAIEDILEQGDVWWLTPLQPDWKKFNFSRISPEAMKRSFLPQLKQASFNQNAGEFYWLEIDWARREEIGEGLLVIEGKTGKILAFRFIANMVKKNGLGIVEIHEFVPKRAVVKWSSTGNYKGIYLEKSVMELVRESLEQRSNGDPKSGKGNQPTE